MSHNVNHVVRQMIDSYLKGLSLNVEYRPRLEFRTRRSPRHLNAWIDMHVCIHLQLLMLFRLAKTSCTEIPTNRSGSIQGGGVRRRGHLGEKNATTTGLRLEEITYRGPLSFCRLLHLQKRLTPYDDNRTIDRGCTMFTRRSRSTRFRHPAQESTRS